MIGAGARTLILGLIATGWMLPSKIALSADPKLVAAAEQEGSSSSTIATSANPPSKLNASASFIPRSKLRHTLPRAGKLITVTSLNEAQIGQSP